MLKIAVTGGVASGKSVALACFERLGAEVIDMDKLARKASRPGSWGFKKIVTQFGREILASDGTLDRKKLRHIIFEDRTSRKWLEATLHPRIFQLYETELATIQARRPNAIIVVEVPLLAELGLRDMFDLVILVKADTVEQKKRVVQRDGGSEEDAKALIDSQMPMKEKQKIADYVIENTGTIKDLKKAAEVLFEKITESFQKGLTL